MSKKVVPNKTKIRRKKTSIKSSDKVNSESSTSTLDKNTRNLLIELEQISVDMHNNTNVYKIDKHFKNLTLSGDKIIIKIFRENYIKYKDNSDPTNPQYIYGYKMIDARERVTDEPNYVPTPFPYVEKGIIVAISPKVQLEFIEQSNKLSEAGVKANVKIPEVGDIVEIKSYYSSTWFKENRYYINKQEAVLDYVVNPSDTSVNVFEHYYVFESYDLLGVSKADKEYFYDEGNDGEPKWYRNEMNYYQQEIKKIDNILSEEVMTSMNKL